MLTPAATPTLPAAKFQNRQNGNAAMRLQGAHNLPFQVGSSNIDTSDPAAEPVIVPGPTPNPESTPDPDPAVVVPQAATADLEAGTYTITAVDGVEYRMA
ncbi:hypothetical protein [Citricoccus sp. I39-566]|uniref:hypothetical protein n=1 Tax=Citricoccus sp. I39-566 TaxID=3073268 RepID=UPI00286C8E6D|nr:hypothetical protein [Citricoccus sp. I39-566]WMY78052.1 hypothetical protein RE421_14680 [Citricoccus sp. I39-566]